MKIIKVECCGLCPNNELKQLKFGGWEDYCVLLMKEVNPNMIDDKCPLDNYKEESYE